MFSIQSIVTSTFFKVELLKSQFYSFSFPFWLNLMIYIYNYKIVIKKTTHTQNRKYLILFLLINCKDNFTSFPVIRQQVSFITSYINLTLSIKTNLMYLPKTNQFNVRTNIIMFELTSFDIKRQNGWFGS